ncbi:MAG: RHS repeat-associated core domain-containing protein, partial [Clostridia bacterium]|nr:RHS repeat-associated core domain-containing protein [Clostridia bacterium]
VDRNDEDIDDMTNIGNMNPFRYNGYYYDVETGFYYLKTRYYDPELGRFISQDSIEYADLETINGLNLYAYCANNPVMYFDPNGNSWKSFWNGVKKVAKKVAAFIGGVITGFAGAAVTLVSFIPALFSPGGAILFQAGMTTAFYGAALIGSTFDSEIYSDMSAIGWNPFNSNAEAVVEASKISFYKGVPVMFVRGMGGSMSLGAIFLDKYAYYGEGIKTTDVLKHERGHNTQLMMMGLGNYLLKIGLPSVIDNRNYTPWELSASMLGGSALANGASISQRQNAMIYLALSPFPIYRRQKIARSLLH